MKRALLALGLAIVAIAGCSEHPPTVTQLNPLPGARLTSGFGAREMDPIRGFTPGAHHDGYDLAAAYGEAIHASKAGTVAFAGWLGGYGNAVVLSHPGGWSTLYGHASKLLVTVGQRVAAGQVIARVGSTGRSTGPHLHYELRHDGVAVDPGGFGVAPEHYRERLAPRRSRPLVAASPRRVGPRQVARALRGHLGAATSRIAASPVRRRV